jgi:hypothetical protein
MTGGFFMDWIIPAITAAAGISGAFIMGCFNLRTQKTAQRNENIRHARKIAYEAAMMEWRGAFNHARERVSPDESVITVPTPETFILNQLAWAETVFEVGARKFSVADYERLKKSSHP